MKYTVLYGGNADGPGGAFHTFGVVAEAHVEAESVEEAILLGNGDNPIRRGEVYIVTWEDDGEVAGRYVRITDVIEPVPERTIRVETAT